MVAGAVTTIRYASAATGNLVWGPTQPIQEQSLVPPPQPIPPPQPNVPVVTVTEFDGLITANGWDMAWNDGNGNHTHIYTKNGGIYVEITNVAGTGSTGKYRRVV